MKCCTNGASPRLYISPLFSAPLALPCSKLAFPSQVHRLTRRRGWDQTGSNGANLSFPVAFGISDSKTLEDGVTPNPHYEKNLWLVGLINAAPYIASAFLGCWMSDPLNNYFGRRGTIFFSAAFCCLSVIGSAVTQNWWELFITRILLGIGMGSKASTVPIFCAENAPAAVRGGLVMCWQMWT